MIYHGTTKDGKLLVESRCEQKLVNEIAEKDQEIAGLKAKLIEVDAIINSWHQSIIGTTEAFVRLSQVNDEDCSTSLKEHDRQVILDATRRNIPLSVANAHDSCEYSRGYMEAICTIEGYAKNQTNSEAG